MGREREMGRIAVRTEGMERLLALSFVASACSRGEHLSQVAPPFPGIELDGGCPAPPQIELTVTQ